MNKYPLNLCPKFQRHADIILSKILAIFYSHQNFGLFLITPNNRIKNTNITVLIFDTPFWKTNNLRVEIDKMDQRIGHPPRVNKIINGDQCEKIFDSY